MFPDRELTAVEIAEYLRRWIAQQHPTEHDHIADLFENGERWMAEAACTATQMPDAWFPSPGHNHQNDPVSAAAMSVCIEVCPVVDKCLAYALNSERKGRRLPGIWGGTSAYQRRQMARGKAAS